MSVDTLIISGTPGVDFTVPVGWTGYANPFRMYSSSTISQTPGGFGQIVTTTECSGVTVISIDFMWATNTNVEWGCAIINTSRTGVAILVQNQGAQIRKEVAGSGGTQLDSVSGLGIVAGLQQLQITRDAADNSVVVKLNDVEILSAVYSDVVTGLFAGIQQYDQFDGNTYTAVSVENDAATTSIDTITTGGVSGLKVGSGFAIETTGLGNLTEVTIETLGLSGAIVTAQSLSAFAGDGNAIMPDWVVGEKYPKPGTVTVIADDGALTATTTTTLSIPDDHSDVIFDTVILSDNTYISKVLSDAGHPLADGDAGYYPIGNSLEIFPDGKISVAGAMTFVLWVQKVDGTMEAYDVVVNDAGAITGATGITFRGITSRSITVRGITRRSLS